ncbi:Dnah1 [Scenedesmus sp. PABB004]|nr:Dnah1 [Scenedesmus sp. PABB004]
MPPITAPLLAARPKARFGGGGAGHGALQAPAGAAGGQELRQGKPGAPQPLAPDRPDRSAGSAAEEEDDGGGGAAGEQDHPHLLPAVMAPYVTRPGETPRQVLIQRRRRLYAAQSIAELVARKGLDPAALAGEPDWREVEVFDDTTFESREPEQWVPRIPGIPKASARVAVGGGDGGGGLAWLDCTVLDHDAPRNRYLVQLRGAGAGAVSPGPAPAPFWAPRLALCFGAEDPGLYARRFAAALAGRAAAARALAAELAVDSMPVDDVPQLTTEAVNRVLNCALNSRRLKERLMDASALVNEAHLEHARGLNKAALLSLAARGDGGGAAGAQLLPLLVPAAPAQRAAPARGTLAMPPGYDFRAQLGEFAFRTLLTKPEVVVKLCLFSTFSSKSVRLEEFEQAQVAATDSVANHLRDNWSAAIKNIIKQAFKDVGKGWYHLGEASWETYRFSKLRRFLGLVRLGMEDALRSLAKGSMALFVAFMQARPPSRGRGDSGGALRASAAAPRGRRAPRAPAAAAAPAPQACCGDAVDVASPPEVALQCRDGARHAPLLLMELVVSPDGASFAYATPVDAIHARVVAVFDRALTKLQARPARGGARALRRERHRPPAHTAAAAALTAACCPQGLAQLEPAIMDQLFWPSVPLLSAVHPQEEVAVRARHALSGCLLTALQPLRSHLAQYGAYEPLLGLNVEAHVDALAAPGGELGLADVSREVSAAAAELARMEETLPATVCLGVAQVNCVKVRELLLRKQERLVGLLKGFVARVPRDMLAAAGAKAAELERQLRAKAGSIEEVDAQRRLIAEQLPAKLAALAAEVEGARPWYAALEGMRYLLPDDEARDKLAGQSWQVKLLRQAERSLELLQVDEACFADDMDAQQEEFGGKITSLAAALTAAQLQTDLANVDSVAASVASLDAQLRAAEREAAQLNAREGLLGRPATDYSQLRGLADVFDPFVQFWSAVGAWKVRVAAMTAGADCVLAARFDCTLTAVPGAGRRDQANHASWMSGPLEALDGEAVERDVGAAFKTLFKMGKVFASRGLEQMAANADAVRAEVEEFRALVPLVQALRNPGMRPRHWDQLGADLGLSLRPDGAFTLRRALEQGLLAHLPALSRVAEVASKEYAIEQARRRRRRRHAGAQPLAAGPSARRPRAAPAHMPPRGAQALDKLQCEWEGAELGVLPYRDTGTCVIKVEEGVSQQLDDHIVMLQSMAFSPYKKPFEERLAKWDTTLNLVSEVLDHWVVLQRAWMYLEPIFSSDDITQQLPLEAKRFATVDRGWRKTLDAAKRAPGLLKARAAAQGSTRVCGSPKLRDQLVEANKLLDGVQKGLADYLETKRLAFARFFFLSNDELLQILSQTKNPLAVQPHLRKCFEAISRRGATGAGGACETDPSLQVSAAQRALGSGSQPAPHRAAAGRVRSLDFGPDLAITAMNSAEKEKVPFDRPMAPSGSIETWLGEIVAAMHAHATRPRAAWVREWPAMVVLAVSQIFWAHGVEEAVAASSVQAYLERCTSDLMALTELVQGPLSEAERLTLGALITVDVHARDVVQELVDAGALCMLRAVRSHSRTAADGRPAAPRRSGLQRASDFEWVSRLRYYWRDDVFVDMAQASIAYGYEYLGNSARLVITPLTDRCYLTLMSAMHLTLGGAPAGPAGTGKTETTKDLAKALAKHAAAANRACCACCARLPPPNDAAAAAAPAASQGKFFKGLAASGAWACFDEFNRIDLEVLSVIAQQILTIQLAIQAKHKRFIFEGTEIELNPACAVYITMNPGYAGRSELPDNLKALFRPCAMMVPDYALIAEISLYGYRSAKALARKMVATFKLCSEQLSSCDHYGAGSRLPGRARQGRRGPCRLSPRRCAAPRRAAPRRAAPDYGMRAVKSVITAAGNLKRAAPGEAEEVLLLRALRDVNVPKFLAHDLPLFDGIIRDLFPGVAPPKVDYGALLAALGGACGELGLQPAEPFLAKVVQLHETTHVRHGLMLVGPTMAGKTCCYRALARAMGALAAAGEPGCERVRTAVLNPKAITMGQLYGQFDDDTHEWTDGVLACHMREFAADAGPDRKWLVFDGPVDALWIENMNTGAPPGRLPARGPRAWRAWCAGAAAAADDDTAACGRAAAAVLDDNKKLCLVSGEIIAMSPSMTMVFEVEDLAVASPATVSRRGAGLPAQRRRREGRGGVAAWARGGAGRPAPRGGGAQLLAALFDALVPDGLSLVRRQLRETVQTTSHGLVASCLGLMDALLRPYGGQDGVPAPEALATLPRALPSLMLFAVVWSLGASCDRAGRERFDAWLRECAAGLAAREGGGGDAVLPDGALMPPGDASVYEWAYDREAHAWVPWMDTVPEFRCDPDRPFASIVVPTADTVRYTHLLDVLLSAGRHVLAVGETGTGKSLTLGAKLLGGMPPEVQPLCMTFSARTSANQTQDIIDSKMDKRRKGVYGPPAGKRCVIFVDGARGQAAWDAARPARRGAGRLPGSRRAAPRRTAPDLNMPQRERYFAQPPLELLRQWLDHGGWYERRPPCAFRALVDCQLVGAMGPPGGGRNPVSARLLRHFNVLSFVELGDDSVGRIFTTILGAFLTRHFAESIAGLTTQARRGRWRLVAGSVELYNAIRGELLPTPSKSHYTFNLRDLAKVVQGLMRADPKTTTTREQVRATSRGAGPRRPRPCTAAASPPPRAQVLALWLHESARVFEDRLTCAEDHAWFRGRQDALLGKHFGLAYAQVAPQPRLLYGDFLVPGAEPKARARRALPRTAAWRRAAQLAGRGPTGHRAAPAGRCVRRRGAQVYAQVSDVAGLVKQVEGYLEDYNATAPAPMRLVLFQDAVEHVSRIARVLRQPLGHALLLGVGGSGRASLARLAAFICDYDLVGLEISKGYGQAEWREARAAPHRRLAPARASAARARTAPSAWPHAAHAIPPRPRAQDLKRVLLKAGLEGRDTVFLLRDTQIVQEAFLEDVNNILNSGEVPNLLGPDDLEAIAAGVRPAMAAAGLAVTKQSIYSFFVSRVRACLHLVLCFSPVGEAFRQRLRMFPALVSSTTIDWFSAWPVEALQSVARSFCADLELGGLQLDGVLAACVHIHQSVEAASKRYHDELRRHNYVTPTSYLELLTTFLKLLADKRAEVTAAKRRLEGGLDKLTSTAAQVEVMQRELQGLQPVLAATAAEVEGMMATIAADKAEAAETKRAVTQQEADASEQAAAAKAIAADAQRDLDAALPALDAAVASLKNLSRNDVVEVRSLQNPPGGVKLVMEAACILLDEKPKMRDDPAKMGARAGRARARRRKKVPDYWDASKRLLSDATKFLDSLLTFDKDNIPEAIIRRIEPFMASEEFTPEAVAKVSKACTSICMWVRAMHLYHTVALGVAPKRAALAAAQEALDATLAELAAAQARLAAVQERIAVLEAQFEEATAKKAALAAQVADCQVKLQRADKLIGGLGGERSRWAATVQQLQADMDNLVGDVVLAAGAIAYSGPFVPSYRAALLADWTAKLTDVGLPFSPHAGLAKTLADPVQVRAWTLAGLPSDSVSVENAIIVSRAWRWPLMVDPQGQANRWVRAMERGAGLEVVRTSNKDFLRTLENGIRFGRPVLLEDLGEGALDAALEPLLLRATFKQGGGEVIRLGDSVVPYHADFKFYMTTKLPNPHYPPEVSVKVSLLNFFVTPEGLEDQLLGAVERPDLASLKSALVVSNAKMKAELAALEGRILGLLSASSGNILDDEELIATLAQAKVTSNEVSARVAQAEATEREIDCAREAYRPVAERASLLFFAISELAGVEPMYAYSLGWFLGLFARAIDDAPKAASVAERGELLNAHFTYSLYVNVCRSLFERHKLLLSFMLATRVQQHAGAIDPAEWRFLLAGPGAASADDGDAAGAARGAAAPPPNPAPAWLTDKAWAELLGLSALPAFAGLAAHAHALPLAEPFEGRLSRFQRLLLLRCLRPDRVLSGVQEFVAAELGPRFVEPPPFDLAACFKESSATTPLVFVLSPGADPMADLLKLAEQLKFSRKFEKVSLGQGQGPHAERLLELGMERGLWVCLQNCHLAVSWLPTLERIVEGMAPERVHKDFRLWLTSMPSPAFPASILQNGVKMTLEPPAGLKANLLRQYNRFTEQYLATSSKPREWRRLVYGLCLFHAVVQDRRKFGPLGWNIRYDFTDGDLSVSLAQLHEYLDAYEAPPFKVLQFLITEINYGGRVTDDKDRRLMASLVTAFCAPPALEEGHAFSPSATYVVPGCETVAQFTEVIRGLPLLPAPEIYGLHDNADITYQQAEAYELLGSLLGLQPRTSGGGGGRSQEDVLPAPLDCEAIAAAHPPCYGQSMNGVLGQEAARYNVLLRAVGGSLRATLQALRGLTVMGPDLERVADALFDNQVPEAWAALAYPSLKGLSSWVADLADRVAFIATWARDGPPPAFLTGTLQNYARKHGCAIDTVSFGFEVRYGLDAPGAAPVDAGPPDGCYVRGLFLEGARWDAEAHALAESRPKELFTELPTVALVPAQHRRAARGVYECPLYKTLCRAGTLSTTGHSTNYVMMLELPSAAPPEHWVNRGVALFAALAF